MELIHTGSVLFFPENSGNIFYSKEIKMSDEYIGHASSHDKSDQVKGNLLVTGVSILAASTLVIAAFAGFD
jgi:hypothetical protein